MGVVRCDICGAGIKKTSYQWNTGKRTLTLCPRCNSQMEAERSRELMRRYREDNVEEMVPVGAGKERGPGGGCGCLLILIGAVVFALFYKPLASTPPVGSKAQPPAPAASPPVQSQPAPAPSGHSPTVEP